MLSILISFTVIKIIRIIVISINCMLKCNQLKPASKEKWRNTTVCSFSDTILN